MILLAAVVIAVQSDRACVDAREVESRLGAAIALAGPAREADLTIDVRASADTVVLRARDREDVTVLEREWQIAAPDCASIPDLLATVLTRFLDTFPPDRWSRPRPPLARAQRFREPRALFRVSASAAFVPSQAEPLLLLGGEGEAAFSAPVWRSLSAGVVARGGVAGTGVLGELGVQRTRDAVAYGIAARSGLFFHEGADLVWVEAGAWIAGRTGPGWLGPHVWIAPGRGRDIPSGRVGATIVAPF